MNKEITTEDYDIIVPHNVLRDCCTVVLSLLENYLELEDNFYKRVSIVPSITYLTSVLGRTSVASFMTRNHPDFRGIINFLIDHKLKYYADWDKEALKLAIEQARNDLPEKWVS